MADSAVLDYQRGFNWFDKGDYDQAIIDYSEAIRVAPRYASAYYERGLAWSRKREPDKAIGDYTEAIRLNSNYAAAFYERGILHNSRREYEKAIADYAEAARLSPNNHTYHGALAMLLATCPDAAQRNADKAVEHATRACELAEWKNPGHLAALAAACAEKHDFEQAVALIDQALELAHRPNDIAHLRRQAMRKAFMARKRWGDLASQPSNNSPASSAQQPSEPAQNGPNVLTSESGRFRVRMPAPTKATVEDVGDGRKHYGFSTTYLGENTFAVFRVSYIDLPKVTNFPTPQDALEAFRSGFRQKSKFEEDRELALGPNKVPGREHRLQAADGAAVRERMFLDGDRIYILFVATPARSKEFLSSEAADDFFDSFAVIRPARQ